MSDKTATGDLSAEVRHQNRPACLTGLEEYIRLDIQFFMIRQVVAKLQLSKDSSEKRAFSLQNLQIYLLKRSLV